MKRIVLSLTIIAALSAPIVHAKEPLKILSTIKPVHSLVAAIAGDLAAPQQILPNYASPHHYSLKPSDLRRLNGADLVFRIGPNLERFLEKSLRNIPEQKIISLAHNKALHLLEAKESHDHSADEVHDHHEAEETTHSLDYHLWLNPENAIIMANTIRDALTLATPEHKVAFAKNTQQLISHIRQKSQDITQQLSAVKTTPFLVMHDAWQYFTQYYQLNQLGTISAQERLSPSAKAISEARATITGSNVHCLVAEPNLKRKTLNILTEGLSINITEIDPLGREIPESTLAYPLLLQYTADKLLKCMTKK